MTTNTIQKEIDTNDTKKKRIWYEIFTCELLKISTTIRYIYTSDNSTIFNYGIVATDLQITRYTQINKRNVNNGKGNEMYTGEKQTSAHRFFSKLKKRKRPHWMARCATLCYILSSFYQRKNYIFRFEFYCFPLWKLPTAINFCRRIFIVTIRAPLIMTETYFDGWICEIFYKRLVGF